MRLASVFIFLSASTFAFAAAPNLKVEAMTDRDLYLADASNLIYSEIHVSSPAEAPRAKSRSIRNISFVIDRSGSMAGPAIQAIRQAIPSVLKNLDDHDVVSVVLFGSEVKALVEAGRRDQLQDIDALLTKTEPIGGASLYDALNQGAAQLRRYAGPSTSNHLILISDGSPTKGPREFDDFSKLVSLFTNEKISVSTVGLGPDFNEDLLAGIARVGNGRFRYVKDAQNLVEALDAELDPLRRLVARDLIVTVKYDYGCESIEAYGWIPSVIEDRQVSFRIPYFFAGQNRRFFTSTKMRPKRNQARLAEIKVNWIDAEDDSKQDATFDLEVNFDGNTDAVRRSANIAVVRTSVSTVISEGLEQAIEEIDKGDFRRAMRALRRAKGDAESLNYLIEDEGVSAKIKELSDYLSEVQKRGMNRLDRKIMRSGLYNQFDTPTADDKAEH